MNNQHEEHSFDNHHTQDIHQDIDKENGASSPIASLIERSKLTNNSELKDASAAIINGLTDPNTSAPRIKSAWIEYAKIAEQIVEAADATDNTPNTYAKAQIEAIMHKSLIFQATGNTLRYLEELDRAETYAHNTGFEEMSTTINDEIAATVDTLPMSSEVLILKLKGIISEDNREFLRDLIAGGDDFEDMINHAYGMILEEGDDPDEVFAELGIV